MSNLLAARHGQRPSGSELRLTVRQLLVEVIELGSSPGDFAAALLDLNDQLRLRLRFDRDLQALQLLDLAAADLLPDQRFEQSLSVYVRYPLSARGASGSTPSDS